jgi:hypothetical protein
MAILTPDGLDQFRVRFVELARVRRGDPVRIDPYLVAQAIALVMRECQIRSALGQPILWNQYRLILARTDFDQIRPLQAPLERDLKLVLAHEAQTRQAELVGELRVTVVFDEADELAPGEGVVRVAFVPTDKLAAPRPGELTMRIDSWAVAGEIAASAPRGEATVMVGDAAPGLVVRWPGGEAALAIGATTVIGRPHPDSPPQFIALAGAGARVNKQQAWITAAATTIRVGRFAKANPVHVNGTAIGAGADLEVAVPAEIALSHGELVVVVHHR